MNLVDCHNDKVSEHRKHVNVNWTSRTVDVAYYQALDKILWGLLNYL